MSRAAKAEAQEMERNILQTMNRVRLFVFHGLVPPAKPLFVDCCLSQLNDGNTRSVARNEITVSEQFLDRASYIDRVRTAETAAHTERTNHSFVSGNSLLPRCVLPSRLRFLGVPVRYVIIVAK